MPQNRLTYLIHRIASESSQSAFEEIHKIYFSGLLSFGVSIIKDRHLAEEVIEDVFVNMWMNRKTLPTIKSLSNYLYISVKHACLNTLKSRSFNNAVKKTALGEVSEVGEECLVLKKVDTITIITFFFFLLLFFLF